VEYAVFAEEIRTFDEIKKGRFDGFA